MIKGWYYSRNPKVRISQKPLDRRRAEWKSSERIRFVKVKSTPYLMVEFSLLKWNLRFQSTTTEKSPKNPEKAEKEAL